jgi:hypothetical protein
MVGRRGNERDVVVEYGIGRVYGWVGGGLSMDYAALGGERKRDVTLSGMMVWNILMGEDGEGERVERSPRKFLLG